MLSKIFTVSEFTIKNYGNSSSKKKDNKLPLQEIKHTIPTKRMMEEDKLKGKKHHSECYVLCDKLSSSFYYLNYHNFKNIKLKREKYKKPLQTIHDI